MTTNESLPSVSGKYPIQDIFRKFYPACAASHPVTEEQQKAANCIINCKTGRLGYNISICPKCGTTKIHASSCNNRHCPCCQSQLEQKWICAREAELVKGCAYYHVVFTIPHELNSLFYLNQETLYSLLFNTVSDTLITLCRDPKYLGATPGIIMVLHTWGAKLNYHPHIHCCVSGGGLTASGKFIEGPHKGFLIPERAAGAVFRGKFLGKLKSLHDEGKLSLTGGCGKYRNRYEWKDFVDSLYKKSWLPFLKETFNGNGNAVKYIARYAYRTAISNSRIVSVTDTEVTFKYKDYTDNGATKLRTVTGENFIRLFLQHVLPKGFTRVRFAGFLNNARRKKNLILIHKLRHTAINPDCLYGLSTHELMIKLYHMDICKCPKCGRKMEYYPRGRPRPQYVEHLTIGLTA